MLYPLLIQLPVTWGDMDAFEHVNNTVYFKWCESARMAFFEQIELEKTRKITGIGPILASIQCRFRLPLFYPDRVSIRVGVARLGQQDFELDYEIYSEKNQAIAASAKDRCVVYDYRNAKKTDLPEQIRLNILRLQPELATKSPD